MFYNANNRRYYFWARNIILFYLVCILWSNSVAQAQLQQVKPEEVGLNSECLAFIDPLIEESIAEGNTPGAVVVIGRGNKIAFAKAYGNRQVKPAVETMTLDTLFDLASVSKVASTAICTNILIDRGLLNVDDSIIKYFPEFASNGKDKITVRHCLTHTAGLPPDNSIKDYIDCSQDQIWSNICRLKLEKDPGVRFAYSDVGFIVLGKLVEKISGKPLDVFARENIYGPLGMKDTTYNPGPALRARTASTEKRRPEDKDWIKGVVHDPRSFAMNGVAGHAGLFSTGLDLAILGAALLNQGSLKPQNVSDSPIAIMTPKAFQAMNTPQFVTSGVRSLGWDKRSSYSGNRGWLMTPSAFGHGGFTGTAFWIDPDNDLFVVFLATRLHPDGKGGVNALAGKVGSIAVDSIIDRRTNEDFKAIRTTTASMVWRSKKYLDLTDKSVLNGIDVLEREKFALLKDKNVALITNQTGINRRGVSIPKLLLENGVKVISLLSPEHGLSGKLDQSNIDDTKDPETGLPVYSLYGDTRRPTINMMKGVDTIVFDIQDIGTRFYTYISTMGGAMQAAADLGVKFVVLDRVNPIGGDLVEGPMLDPGYESFVAFAPLTIRHGMTVGEIALMFNQEQHLNLDLTIVPLENWKRSMLYTETKLPWINPSPNMRSPLEEALYPGTGIPEFTNISVGRGTSTPFEVMGAPWINADQTIKNLESLQREYIKKKGTDQWGPLTGVKIEPCHFTPDAGPHKNTLVHGIRYTILDPKAFSPVAFGITVMRQLKIDYPEQWKRDRMNTLLLHRKTVDLLEKEAPVENILAEWEKGRTLFEKIRNLYLIY